MKNLGQMTFPDELSMQPLILCTVCANLFTYCNCAMVRLVHFFHLIRLIHFCFNAMSSWRQCEQKKSNPHSTFIISLWPSNWEKNEYWTEDPWALSWGSVASGKLLDHGKRLYFENHLKTEMNIKSIMIWTGFFHNKKNQVAKLA